MIFSCKQCPIKVCVCVCVCVCVGGGGGMAPTPMSEHTVLVLVLLITGKGTACIPGQHKICTIIRWLYKNKSRIS